MRARRLAHWQNVRGQIETLSGDIHDEVRIVSIPAPLVRILPRAIEATSRQHPHIAFRVIDVAPKEHSEEMRARRPDIAILFIDRRHRGYEVAARIRMRIGAIMAPAIRWRIARK